MNTVQQSVVSCKPTGEFSDPVVMITFLRTTLVYAHVGSWEVRERGNFISDVQLLCIIVLPVLAIQSNETVELMSNLHTFLIRTKFTQIFPVWEFWHIIILGNLFNTLVMKLAERES